MRRQEIRLMPPPVVPGYVPLVLLLGLEVAAVVIMLIAVGRRPPDAAALLVCARCLQLHARTEAIARIADAVAVGALAFLIALPFVAAGYEGDLGPANTLLAASAVIAVLAAAAEADFLQRALAARIWPRLTWDAGPARIVGGGARWAGVILAAYISKAAYTGAGGAAPGMSVLFGGLGGRVAADLTSTWTVSAAAAILAVAAIAALVARWLLPLLFHSLPITLAVRRDPHGTSA